MADYKHRKLSGIIFHKANPEDEHFEMRVVYDVESIWSETFPTHCGQQPPPPVKHDIRFSASHWIQLMPNPQDEQLAALCNHTDITQIREHAQAILEACDQAELRVLAAEALDNL